LFCAANIVCRKLLFINENAMYNKRVIEIALRAQIPAGGHSMGREL
jgi:hypothetical protein